jgi:hypothetical protein
MPTENIGLRPRTFLQDSCRRSELETSPLWFLREGQKDGILGIQIENRLVTYGRDMVGVWDSWYTIPPKLLPDGSQD